MEGRYYGVRLIRTRCLFSFLSTTRYFVVRVHYIYFRYYVFVPRALNELVRREGWDIQKWQAARGSRGQGIRKEWIIIWIQQKTNSSSVLCAVASALMTCFVRHVTPCDAVAAP